MARGGADAAAAAPERQPPPPSNQRPTRSDGGAGSSGEWARRLRVRHHLRRTLRYVPGLPDSQLYIPKDSSQTWTLDPGCTRASANIWGRIRRRRQRVALPAEGCCFRSVPSTARPSLTSSIPGPRSHRPSTAAQLHLRTTLGPESPDSMAPDLDRRHPSIGSRAPQFEPMPVRPLCIPGSL
jgi:hypothetical protein